MVSIYIKFGDGLNMSFKVSPDWYRYVTKTYITCSVYTVDYEKHGKEISPSFPLSIVTSTFETISINFLDYAENSSFKIFVTRNVKMLILNVIYKNQKETLVTFFLLWQGEKVSLSLM